MPRERGHRFACRTVWTGARQGPTRSYEGYSRELEVTVEGKPILRGSAAAAFRGDPALHNPEDWLVAALSACHMLSYLALCARAGIAVTGYEDDATGTMERSGGTIRFTSVVLRPRVAVAAGTDLEEARALHERAHAACFIASSVNFPVTFEPVVE